MQRFYIQYRIDDRETFFGELHALELVVPKAVPKGWGKLWARWVVVDRIIEVMGCRASEITIINMLDVPSELRKSASVWDLLLTQA